MQIPGRLFPHHDNQSIYLLLHLILNHPIPNPDLRKHILRFRWILLQFPSNMCHIHAQNTVIIVRIRPPDIRNNRIIRHDSAGILCQQGDNLKLDYEGIWSRLRSVLQLLHRHQSLLRRLPSLRWSGCCPLRSCLRWRYERRSQIRRGRPAYFH